MSGHVSQPGAEAESESGAGAGGGPEPGGGGGAVRDPHDRVFRKVAGVPANAASMLRGVLPAGLAARLDLGQLRAVPAAFTSQALKGREADLLFTAPLGGREAFVYLLVEHQSQNDPLMAFRVVRYVVQILDAWLDQHKTAARLPAVIPLVVHQGRKGRWRAPVQLLDLFDLDPGTLAAVRAHLPQLEFLLEDLAVAGEQELRARLQEPAMLLMMLLLKTAPDNPALPADLRRWAGDLEAAGRQPGGRELLIALFTYIELVASAEAAGELDDVIASLSPQVQEAYMTIADMRLAKGRAEGRAEGEAIGRASLLLEQLTLKFGKLPGDMSETVKGGSGDELRMWAGRVLTATTLDEVFRPPL